LIKEDNLKVILTKDYEKLGHAGEIINVKDGFAKNFLIPGNVVLPATKGNINQMELVKKSLIKKEAKDIDEARQVAERIGDLTITFTVNASPEGKLYGSITNKDIAEKIFAEKKVEIDKKKIELEEHIKEVGDFEVEIKLYKDVKSIVKVIVKGEETIVDTEKTVEKTEQSQAE
jgi:large subunit ribosomal protein L9